MIAELIIGPHDKHGRGGGKTDSGWQMDGWVRWLEGLRGQYERRMRTMCGILEEGKEIVKSGRYSKGDMDGWSVVEKIQIYDFVWPRGGMFVWVRLHFETHPLWPKLQNDPEKLAHALWVHLTTAKYLVLVAPGSIFAPTEQIRHAKSWMFFRICFAAVDEPEVEKTSRRFVDGVRSFWGKKTLDDVEELAGMGVDARDGLMDLRGGC